MATKNEQSSDSSFLISLSITFRYREIATIFATTIIVGSDNYVRSNIKKAINQCTKSIQERQLIMNN